jgi:hypothetical protein
VDHAAKQRLRRLRHKPNDTPYSRQPRGFIEGSCRRTVRSLCTPIYADEREQELPEEQDDEERSAAPTTGTSATAAKSEPTATTLKFMFAPPI